MRHRAALVRLIRGDAWRMAALEALAAERLPDAWIGAGFARNAVWDKAHDLDQATPLADLDVVYFDPAGCAPGQERAIERRLRGRFSAPWSVRNQARMHQRNGDPPYRSTAHALTFWLETATAVALRLGAGGELHVLAPLGLEDLYALVVRPTPSARARAPKLRQYQERLRRKSWPARWPLLTVRAG